MTVIERITALGNAWLEAKAAEAEANANRLAIEAELVKAMPAVSDESTQKLDVGALQVRVEYGVTRSVDTPKLQALWGNLDEAAQSAFSWKATPKTAELRAIQNLRPEIYTQLAAVLTVKPSKPSVKVVMVEKEAA